FKTFSQFSRKCFKFLFVHNLPVSVVGVKISKTGNYTILFTVSKIRPLSTTQPYIELRWHPTTQRSGILMTTLLANYHAVITRINQCQIRGFLALLRE
ncbi:hypothetical protein B7R70_21330, partial [Yersinia pseudotuberculosis]